MQLSELEQRMEAVTRQIEDRFRAAMVPAEPGMHRDENHGLHSVELSVILDEFSPHLLDMNEVSALMLQYRELRNQEREILKDLNRKSSVESALGTVNPDAHL